MPTYYNIRTNDISKYWNTTDVIKLLTASNIFKYKNNGCLECIDEYCFISLLYVKDFDSYACPNDFDDEKTNLISVVTSFELSKKVLDVLKNLAYNLNSRLVEEE